MQLSQNRNKSKVTPLSRTVASTASVIMRVIIFKMTTFGTCVSITARHLCLVDRIKLHAGKISDAGRVESDIIRRLISDSSWGMPCHSCWTTA